MTGIRIEINDALIAKFKNVSKERMEEAVNELRNTVLEMLAGQRHGRVYKVPGTQREYTASAPGEPPAQRLGELRGSISGEVITEDGKVVGIVGTDKEHGLHMEFGTKTIAPRPWLKTSADKAVPKIAEIFKKDWL